MRKIFGFSSKLMNIMNRAADLLLLNILFIVTSIPIITIGASVTALYSVMMKVCMDVEGYIIKDYFQTFKRQFMKASCLWGIFIGIAAVIGVDAYFYIFSARAVFFMRYLFYILLICFVFILSYSFVVLEQMKCTVGNVLKNAIVLSIRFLPYTLAIVLCNLLSIIIIMVFPRMLPYVILTGLIIGFSGTAYINSHFFNKIFR